MKAKGLLGLALLSSLGVNSAFAVAGCGTLRPSQEQIISIGRVGYLVSSKIEVTQMLVAEDLREVLAKLSEGDKNLAGLKFGQVSNKADAEKLAGGGGRLLGEVASFEVQQASGEPAGSILVCKSGSNEFAIALDKVDAQRPYLTTIADTFMRGEKIEAAGTRVWPREEIKK